MYGSPYDHGKQDLIDEQQVVLGEWDGPTLLGGDSNLTWTMNDNNNGNVNFHWSDLFNNWINHWSLIELKNLARSYTWTDNQGQPTMAVLDRIFATARFQSEHTELMLPRIARFRPYLCTFISPVRQAFMWPLICDTSHFLISNFPACAVLLNYINSQEDNIEFPYTGVSLKIPSLFIVISLLLISGMHHHFIFCVPECVLFEVLMWSL